MKLKYKIMLIFCSTMLASVMVIGTMTVILGSGAVTNTELESIQTESVLVSNNISTQLKDYLAAVTVVGKARRCACCNAMDLTISAST